MSDRVRSSRQRYEAYRSRQRKTGYSGPARPATPGTEPGPDASPRPRRSRSFWVLLREFWRLASPYRGTVIASLATLSVATVLGLLMPACTKIAVDYIITDNPGPAGLPGPLAVEGATPGQRVRLLGGLAAAMIGLTAARIAVGLWGRWRMTRVTKRLQARIRRRLFDHAVRLPLHRVYALKSGGAASLLREDAGGSAELLFKMFYNPWSALLQLAGTLAVLAWVDWRMLLGALVLIPTVWMTHQTWISRIRPVQRDIRQTRQGIDAHATEAFGGMRVVRGFGRASGEATRFVTANHYMGRQELLSWQWSRGIDVAWQLIIPVATTAVLVYGGWRVVQGALTIGDVMMFTAYVFMLLSPLEVLAVSATDMQTQLAGLDRVLDVLEEPREFAAAGRGARVPRSAVSGRITLDDVWFTYPARRDRRGDGRPREVAPRPVIRGVSLDVPAGRTVALVGPSGSGKTTLCNLVARFFDPDRGRVLLDGRDLREIDVQSYRRLLGIVEQDVFLFDGTVAENIAYARRGAGPDQVRAAAEAANAAGFIAELERGYETLIGERGVRLSGGQKQRIAIARALLADPKILILDEATSNLDTHSELLIQHSLRDLMLGRTCFVIAHRLSTVRHADRIVVIEDGAVTESGSHDELMAAGGRYADLVRVQLGGAEALALPQNSSAGPGHA